MSCSEDGRKKRQFQNHQGSSSGLMVHLLINWLVARKPFAWEQQMRRSACLTVQFDQRICHSFIVNYNT